MVAGEVNAQRDERVTLLLHLADQARDLLAVQQELARAQRVMVHDIALSVRRDVNVLQPRLAVVDSHETIAKVGPSVPDRLHLRPGEHHPRFVLLIDEVVVVGAAVDRDVPVFVVPIRHRRGPASRARASCPAAARRRARSDRLRGARSTPSPDLARSAE